MEGLQYGIQQGYNPMAAGAYASQLGPQGLSHGLAGAPLAGLVGSGIAGLLTGQNARQPGQFVDGFGGTLVPHTADPVTAYLQQIQLAQLQAQLAQQGQVAPQGQFAHQGWFGHPAGSIGQPLNATIGGIFGNPYVGNPYVGNQYAGNQIGLLASQLGRFSPFGIDPVAAAYAQQRAQLAQLLAQQLQLGPQGPFGQAGQFGQGWYANVPAQIGGGIANPWANPQFDNPIGNFPGPGIRMQPFHAGLMGAAAGYGGFPAY